MSQSDVLTAYADDLVALESHFTDLQHTLALAQRALDVAIAERTALHEQLDTANECLSITLAHLHAAVRDNDRLTEQLREARAQKR